LIRLAISGHRGLPTETEELITTELRRVVGNHAQTDLVGISCLADGADSIFARAILDAGGRLIVVIPAKKYREGFPRKHLPVYDSLLQKASETIALEYVESDSQAHMDASLRMIEQADELIAVWDGQPARGFGGTADVVAAARDRNIPVTVVWPVGAERD
jgi:hypothetical protein